MSSYEDYDKTSGHYDKTRIPIGVEIILGCLVKSGRALNKMKVLDAGCGTGNYSEELLDHVNQIGTAFLSLIHLSPWQFHRLFSGPIPPVEFL